MIVSVEDLKVRMASSEDVQKAVRYAWGGSRSDPEGAKEVIEWAKDPDMWDIYASKTGGDVAWEFYKHIAEDYSAEHNLNMVAIASLNSDVLEDQTMMYIMDDGIFEDHSGSGFGRY